MAKTNAAPAPVRTTAETVNQGSGSNAPAAASTDQTMAAAADQAPAPPAAAPPAPAAAAKPAPAPQAATARPAEVKLPQERHGRQDETAVRKLILHVCQLFGVNPAKDARPQELLTFTYYQGAAEDDIPDAVSLVTGNGLKLKVFADDSIAEDSIPLLAAVFGVQREKDGSYNLPEDVTLPRVACTGVSASTEHQYKGGYLKSGGKQEAARRQALKKK